jgi:hypothetical protein
MPGSYGSMPGMGMSLDPADRRYVDKDYKPLDAAKVRSDVTTSPTEVYLAVAKRMPVRIVCKIDQRKVHKLLAECGNSPLTVEVRQVRVGENAGKGIQVGGMGGYGSSYGGGYSSDSGSSSDSYGGFDPSGGGYGSGGYGSMGYGSSGGYGSGGYGGGMADAQAANEVTVEMYGIVYIYNPVNKKALGIDETQAPSTEQAAPLTADAGSANNPS